MKHCAKPPAKKRPLLPLVISLLGLSVVSLPVAALSLPGQPLSGKPLQGRTFVATSLTGGLLEDSVHMAVERSVEESVSQSVEGSVEDQIEQAVDASVTDAVEGKVSQAVEDSIQQAVTDRVGESVAEGVAETVTQSAEAGIGDSVDSALGNTVDTAIGQTVADLASQSALAGIEGGVSGTLGDSLGNLPEQAVGPIGDSSLGEALQQTLGTVADNGTEAVVSLLPPVVAVLDRSGATLFHDVEVENRWRAVQREWLVMIDDGDLPQLEKIAIRIVEHKRFEQLGMSLVRFRVDEAMDSRKALETLLPAAKAWRLERNHIYNYRPQSDRPSTTPGAPARSAAVCDDPLSIGIVDTAVDDGHPAFAKTVITQRNFLDAAIDPPRNHGTAVAGILVGRGEGLQPVVPNALLSVASVMYQREDGSQGATVMGLLEALDWLAGRGVAVINLSLAGPPNQLLERAVAALDQRNILLVAAVGNEGPAAPALYPAAYSPVIGVTAVDREQRIYRWANRGDQVDFAAHGVAVNTASVAGGLLSESGTSMAAPVVSAFAACWQEGEGRVAVFEALAGAATDLGEPGRDPVFGLGLLE